MESKNYRMKFVKYLKGDYVQYQIRLICIEDNSINVEFLERFSNLKDLHESFKKEANSINFPKFPPKKFFGNSDEKFLNQRMTALEHYFNTILGSKEFSNLPSLKKWIDGLIKKYNKKIATDSTTSSNSQSANKESVANSPKNIRQETNPVQTHAGLNKQSFSKSTGKNYL